MSKAIKIQTCVFADVQLPADGTWHIDPNYLPKQVIDLYTALSNGLSELIFKDGLSDMDGKVESFGICPVKNADFQAFLSQTNTAPPFVAIVGVYPSGEKKLYTVKNPAQVKEYARAMWLGEFGGNTPLPSNLGDGDGGWGQGDGGLLCKLLPPVCALGFLPWLALASFSTYKAFEARSTVGKSTWGIPAALLWQVFFARGGVKQIQWWLNKIGK